MYRRNLFDRYEVDAERPTLIGKLHERQNVTALRIVVQLYAS